MKIEKNQRISFIRSLLAGKLTQDQKEKISDFESVKEELKKQWDESGNDHIAPNVKEQIWNRIQEKCIGKQIRIVHTELWYTIAASVAIVLVVGILWLLPHLEVKEQKYIQVIAKENKMYLLPDSSKVWMQPGSVIRYADDFNQDRKVWLKGTSLFEVRKHNDSKFRVYLNKAFIEVKGTCFQIKQDQMTQEEITLFSGKINFNVEATGEVIEMKPLQKVTYYPNKAQIQIENIKNIDWENGKYNFTGIPLAQLIQMINQMYDTNIILKDNIRKKSAFTGSIRYDETIDDVLDKICFSLSLKIEKENNQIIIYN